MNKQEEIDWLKSEIGYLEDLLKNSMLDILRTSRSRRLNRYQERLEKLEGETNGRK